MLDADLVFFGLYAGPDRLNRLIGPDQAAGRLLRAVLGMLALAPGVLVTP